MSESKSLPTTETRAGSEANSELENNEIAAVMRWILIVGVIFAAVAFLMGSLAGKIPVHSPLSTASAGSSAYPPPDFRLATLDGQQLGPLDFPGKVVVVDLWASWCGPCSLQAKFLEELSAEYAGQVQVLAVNIGEDEATVRNHLAKEPYSYPVLLDPSDTLGAKYQVVGLPTVMVINRDGIITFMKTGVTDLPTLRQKVQEAGGPAPANV